MRGDADRAGGEAFQREFGEVDDRRPFADAADDPLGAGSLDQRGEVAILGRVLALDRVFHRVVVRLRADPALAAEVFRRRAGERGRLVGAEAFPVLVQAPEPHRPIFTG